MSLNVTKTLNNSFNNEDDMDLLLIALQEMDREIKEKRREWEKQGGREDQIDRSNYLDGFWHAWQIANRVHNKGAKNTKTPNNEDDMQNQHWCMCVKLKDVARDGRSTCSICGGRDAYGLSTERPEDKKKTITTAST